jgi:hypothetical protein
MVARQPLATVREARYGYAVANMGSNPHNGALYGPVHPKSNPRARARCSILITRHYDPIIDRNYVRNIAHRGLVAY